MIITNLFYNDAQLHYTKEKQDEGDTTTLKLSS